MSFAIAIYSLEWIRTHAQESFFLARMWARVSIDTYASAVCTLYTDVHQTK